MGPALRPATADILLCLVLAAAGAIAPSLAARWARPALIEFGPNDVGYTSGFRQDWERDGLTRFRWTGTHATVTLPVKVSGDGLRLRARLRRHLVEPAEVTVYAHDVPVGRFDIQADLHSPYRTIDLPLPPDLPSTPLAITIQATSVNPRPLGVALDWLEIVRGEGRFALTYDHALRLALVVAAAFAFPLLAGAPRAWALAHAALVLALATAGTAWDVIASERIATEGAPLYLATGALAAAAARSRRLARGAASGFVPRRRRSGPDHALRARPAPGARAAPAVLLPRRQGARAVRLATGPPRPAPIPRGVHREPVPLQPRPPARERALVRVPLSAGVLHVVLAARSAGALPSRSRGLRGGRGGEQRRGLGRLRHRAPPAVPAGHGARRCGRAGGAADLHGASDPRVLPRPRRACRGRRGAPRDPRPPARPGPRTGDRGRRASSSPPRC